ncbi:hypothetical protein DMA15_12520 [Streptomyces sp. WAC 01529]|uniref:hypothetical protein n=1 Tax=Streptomyces sp. WAC 01529 TaxID=2203205 RepID=UPI000F6E0C52|nr:hypothetical protein [Streptomyces sp. WAC 01529]AZM53309.1 hypothetical protein DMA15_12520 [Streptomyces sp. WAC 01529]
MTGIGPTICNPNPGFGLRVRLDHAKAKSLASADWSCPCLRPAEHAVGYDEVEQLVIRAERHMRDECPNEHVRAAAAMRSERRKQHARKRRK